MSICQNNFHSQNLLTEVCRVDGICTVGGATTPRPGCPIVADMYVMIRGMTHRQQRMMIWSCSERRRSPRPGKNYRECRIQIRNKSHQPTHIVVCLRNCLKQLKNCLLIACKIALSFQCSHKLTYIKYN